MYIKNPKKLKIEGTQMGARKNGAQKPHAANNTHLRYFYHN